MIHLIDSLNSSEKENILDGHWPKEDSPIPVYRVESLYELNRLIGYAKYINASDGTILYRGETKMHDHLSPSGARPGRKPVPPDVIDKICTSKRLCASLGLNNEEISDWKLFKRVAVEAVLQHYGAPTNSMDFVDNHWCSLWFGLYKFNKCKYTLRNNQTDGNEEFLYLFLYLADTNRGNIRGLYIGEDTLVVDLRKALSSLYQRPAAQHGWIVSKKEGVDDYNYDDRVIGVLKISVENAKKWLGTGELVSESNFFPSFAIDQGYRTLLSYQKRSGFVGRNKVDPIIPINTIQNYHYRDCFYCSDYDSLPSITNCKQKTNMTAITNLEDLFEILVERGWQNNTVHDYDSWTERNPANGQSLLTAMLINKLLGGTIHSFPIGHRHHFYNIVNDVVIDLAAQDVPEFISQGKNTKATTNNQQHQYDSLYKKHKSKFRFLLKNADIKII